MLKAVGFTDDDLAKPLIGVATTWIETMPCNLNQRELAQDVKRGIREAGACGGQFTANTMSTIMEFLGISPPGLNGIPALSPKKAEAAYDCGRLAVDLVEREVLPSQIVTREALENAAASVVATGGSTNG